MSLGPERVESLRRPLSIWDHRTPGVLQLEPRKMQMYQELLLSGKQIAGEHWLPFLCNQEALNWQTPSLSPIPRLSC